MYFKQLFEPVSSTYTYLIGCEKSGCAVLIDPVINAIERDLQVIAELGLKLSHTLDTHIHADHVTAALALKNRVGSQIAMPAAERLACADIHIDEENVFEVGTICLQPLHTPGHTDSHYAYIWQDRVFTGDALLIDGCGRTDFQNGDPDALYQTVTQKLFTLPEDYLVYPGHDYRQRRVSTIAQEKNRNQRLGAGKTREEFLHIMQNLNLDYPTFIDYAVPANQQCGVCPDDLPQRLTEYCDKMSVSQQG